MAKYILTENQLKSLLEDQATLEALENGGVDNWEWYSESLYESPYWNESTGKMNVDSLLNNYSTSNKNLTDLFKQGNLPEGYYYIKNTTGIEIDYYNRNYESPYFTCNDKEDIIEILAEVPSYEDFQQLNK